MHQAPELGLLEIVQIVLIYSVVLVGVGFGSPNLAGIHSGLGFSTAVYVVGKGQGLVCQAPTAHQEFADVVIERKHRQEWPRTQMGNKDQSLLPKPWQLILPCDKRSSPRRNSIRSEYPVAIPKCGKGRGVAEFSLASEGIPTGLVIRFLHKYAENCRIFRQRSGRYSHQKFPSPHKLKRYHLDPG